MNGEFRKACLTICGAVVFEFAASADLPRFVEAIDRCESLWSNKKYEALFEYINELERAAPDYVPTRILAALRDEHFGEQYEDVSSTIRALTNLAQGVICEVAPEFFQRLGQMADNADSAVRIFERIGMDKDFRKANNDPRKRIEYTSKAPFLSSAFNDLPFLVPNVRLSRSSSFEVIDGPKTKTSVEPLEKEKLARKIFFEKGLAFQEKQNLLDDYLAAKVSKTGVRGLVESFDDDFIQLNGYSVIRILKKEEKTAMQYLREYLNYVDSEKFSDSSLRMAVWAVLQLAHNKTETAAYLSELKTKVIDRNSITREFLFRAIEHLGAGWSAPCDTRVLDVNGKEIKIPKPSAKHTVDKEYQPKPGSTGRLSSYEWTIVEDKGFRYGVLSKNGKKVIAADFCLGGKYPWIVGYGYEDFATANRKELKEKGIIVNKYRRTSYYFVIDMRTDHIEYVAVDKVQEIDKIIGFPKRTIDMQSFWGLFLSKRGPERLAKLEAALKPPVAPCHGFEDDAQSCGLRGPDALGR